MLVLKLPPRFPLQFLLAFALGLLQSASFLRDATWPLQIAALAGVLALVLRSPGPWPAARLGFAFGLGWFLTGIWWLYISLHVYGELAAPLAAAGTFLLCAYLSIYPALACSVTAVFARRAGPRSALVSFPALWAASEGLRGVIFTGFPWIASGYAHAGSPLSGYATIGGVYLVGLLAAALASGVVALSLQHVQTVRQRLLAVGVVILVPLWGLALQDFKWSTPVGAPITARLLQGNIAQDIKFDPIHRDETMAAYFALIESGRADLIVLPETALPFLANRMPAEIIDRLEADSKKQSALIAFGIAIADSEDHYTNSVLSIAADGGQAQRYDKSHLVPFGEFVPLGFHWFVAMLKIPLGDMTSGAEDQPTINLGHQRLGFDICYEDLFGAAIARQARAASILVNASNLAWFGNTRALDEHLQIARMRAIETARPVLRATNTGVTAAIDSHGHVIGQLPPFLRAALQVTVQGTEGDTPYVYLGEWPLWTLVIVWLALSSGIAAKKSRRAGAPTAHPR